MYVFIQVVLEVIKKRFIHRRTRVHDDGEDGDESDKRAIASLESKSISRFKFTN